ncbi:MAG: hypothetical protein Q9184_007495 [Pyrenodesmia sp. 2 TL-2023]
MMQKLAGQTESSRPQSQYRLRLHWKAPNHTARVKIEPDDLAAWFLAVYKKMFVHEDLSTLFSRVTRMQNTHYSTDMPRYTRAALVALMRVVRTRTSTDWDRVMDKFLHLIESDRTLLVGSNSLQELNVHLALYAVWTLPVLAEGPREVQRQFNLPLRPRKNESGILGQANPPPIVYVVMSVPRRSLRPFTEGDVDGAGTPGLHLSIKQQFGPTQYENCFFSFLCCFGRSRPGGQTGEPSTFEEDQKGWRGSSDLFLACAVPTFGLLMGPRNGLKVSLVVNTSPENLMRFAKKLGPLLIVFETPLENEQRVSISTNPLHLDTKSSIKDQQKWLQALSTQRTTEAAACATFDARHQINKLVIRTMPVKESEEGKALTSRALVAVDPIDLFTIRLTIGDTSGRNISFPFPIQSYNSKTRVARRSSWVEIEAAIHVAPQKDPFNTWTYVSFLPDQSFALDYIPRVNLDIQPVMKSITQNDRVWLSEVIDAMGIERKQIKLPEDSEIDMKYFFTIVFVSFMGFLPGRSTPARNLVLKSKRTEKPHAFIFVESLHHDLDLGSVVLDAYVMPLTTARFEALGATTQHLLQHSLSSNINPALTLYLTNEAMTLWKRLLPALAERCRTWQHKDTCEYRKEGKVPLSVEVDENPLCSCGEGIVPQDFTKDNAEWESMASYVTRIALSPVFPVPYVEARAGLDHDLPATQSGPQTGAQPTPSSLRCENCNESSTQLKNCAACGKAKYCSKECQRVAWKAHKLECKK